VTAEELRAAWQAAYRAAEYRVELPAGDLVLRVDVHGPQQDRRLREEAGVRSHWAILTPCNPGSQQLPPGDNAALLEQLEEIVAASSLRTIRSRNHDPSGAWPDEPGGLICDPPPGFAAELGKRFRQNAILAGRLGEAPQLVWLIDLNQYPPPATREGPGESKGP
jgi:hypothetical protein